MSRQWLLVDDQPEDRERFASLLTEAGELKVRAVRPEQNVGFIRKVLDKGDVSGVLLDQALNEADASIAYAGPTLAGLLRTDFPDLPLVVLTAKLRETTEGQRFQRTNELFDWRLDKQHVVDQPKDARQVLKILADGYADLRKDLEPRAESGNNLAEALGLPTDLDESRNRAVVLDMAADFGAKEPFRTARFIIHILLRLAGPLLSPKRAAVALGFDPGSAPELEQHFGGARYTGVFAGIFGHQSYWRELLDSVDLDDDLAPHAQCVVCLERAYELCEVCEKPVDGLHSLPVQRKEPAPEMFLRGRVCAFCLEGALPERLAIDTAYASMREALFSEAVEIQRGREDSP